MMACSLEDFFEKAKPDDSQGISDQFLAFQFNTTNIKILADFARKEEWREILRDAGFLRLALDELVSASGSEKKQVLRLVGNCCIDNNRSREIALRYLDAIEACLSDRELLEVATGALLNIFNDDDERAAAEVGPILKFITKLVPQLPCLVDGSLCTSDAIIFVTSEVESVIQLGLQSMFTMPLIISILRLPAQCSSVLIKDTYDPDFIEEIDSLLDLAILVLEDKYVLQSATEFHQEQIRTSSQGGLFSMDDPLIAALELCQSCLVEAEITYDELPYAGSTVVDTHQNFDLWSRTSTRKLLDSVTNLVSSTDFTILEPETLLDYPVISVLQRWLPKSTKSMEKPQQLEYLAFFVLSAVTRKETAHILSSAFKFHTTACDFIIQQPLVFPPARHAAASFLLNITNVPECRPTVRESRVAQMLIESSDGTDVVYGLRIMRQLALDDIITCTQLLDPSDQTNSLVKRLASNVVGNIDDLMLEDKGLLANKRTHLGRLLVATLRTLLNSPTTLLPREFVNSFFVTLIGSLTQDHPAGSVYNSEGWMGLSLLTRNVESAGLVYDFWLRTTPLTHSHHFKAMQALYEKKSTHEPEPEGMRNLLEADRKNATLLAIQLLRFLGNNTMERGDKEFLEAVRSNNYG